MWIDLQYVKVRINKILAYAVCEDKPVLQLYLESYAMPITVGYNSVEDCNHYLELLNKAVAHGERS